MKKNLQDIRRRSADIVASLRCNPHGEVFKFRMLALFVRQWWRLIHFDEFSYTAFACLDSSDGIIDYSYY